MTLDEYIASVKNRVASNISREHAYRSDFEQLLRQILPDVDVTNEPVNVTDCGSPDFVITRKGLPLGYIEAKDVGKDLDSKAYAEQFSRYRKALDNLIITDYLTFQFFQHGEKVQEISIGELGPNGVKAIPENFPLLERWLEHFATFIAQTVKSPIKLAELMAGKARLLETILEGALLRDLKNEVITELTSQFETFQDMLIHDLQPKQFADLYAQTLAYGLFAARYHDPTLETFDRNEAAQLIPHSNPLLRNLFQSVAGYNIDDRIRSTVDNLAEVFRHSDVRRILDGFGKTTAQNDPIVHFYETFLAKYDPALRKSRGVWYTPEPVVGFIVQAVDEVLKQRFNLPNGLADNSKTSIEVESQVRDKRTSTGYRRYKKDIHRVQLLDPATGTGTFISEVVRSIYTQYFAKNQGIWSSYVENDLVPRLNGFEILMASYAMAHLKLDMLLGETGFKPKNPQQRLRVFLTNSLEEHHPDTHSLFAQWLSNESREANAVKKDTPVMVILGNPPYSGESRNKGDWIMQLMEDYKKEPGGEIPLQERNSKWINDDYVKFMRFAQHFVERNGEGIVAFINPHGFLDNPTFRGMRWNLLKTYDEIYTIDLHGNAKKKEVAPDGSKDENVFDIEQGVSINILIKTGEKSEKELGRVFHHDLFGSRNAKYDYLSNTNFSSVPFQELTMVAPQFYMIPRNLDAQAEYNDGFSVRDLFRVRSVGIATARDNFSIHMSAAQVRNTVDRFLSIDDETARNEFNLGDDVRDWKVHLARRDLHDSGSRDSCIVPISYRPFDFRFTYYTGRSKGFHCMPRSEVMRHFLAGPNLGLSFNRNIEQRRPFTDVFVFDRLIQHHSLSNKEVNNIAPLYLYPGEGAGRIPNLVDEHVREFESRLSLTFVGDGEYSRSSSFSALDVFDYVYAVLHSPTYRTNFYEFLKTDYPKVPYPNPDTFWPLVDLGGRLRDLHLLDSALLDDTNSTYPVEGDNRVTRKMTKTSRGYEQTNSETGRVWINDSQYFDNVPLIAWEFHIGGYQPAQKWLKDRNGMELSFNDIRHYQSIIAALMETHRLMHEVDSLLY